MKMCHIFTLTVDIKNPSFGFEDIHQQIFLAEFHENPTLPDRAVSISESDSLPEKLNQLPPIRSDFHESLQGGSAGKYLQIRGKDFRYLLSK